MSSNKGGGGAALPVTVPVPVPGEGAGEGAEAAKGAGGRVCPTVLPGQQLPKIVAVRLARFLTKATT